MRNDPDEPGGPLTPPPAAGGGGDPERLPPAGGEGAPGRIPAVERYGISPELFALVALLVIFLGYQLVGALIIYLLYGLEPGPESVQGLRAVTAGSQLLLILLPALFFARFITTRPREFLRLHRADLRAFIAPLVGIISLQQMLQVYMIFQARIPFPPEIEKVVRQLNDLIDKITRMLAGSSSLPELAWVIFVVALVPAICEEFLFRGLAQRSFERRIHPMAAAVLTGIIFGAYHLNPFTFVPLAVLGIYLGFLALRARSLWVSVTAHFYNNAYACIALYFHADDTLIGGARPETMSDGFLLALFWLFGVLFLVSTIYFIRITAPQSPPGERA